MTASTIPAGQMSSARTACTLVLLPLLLLLAACPSMRGRRPSISGGLHVTRTDARRLEVRAAGAFELDVWNCGPGDLSLRQVPTPAGATFALLRPGHRGRVQFDGTEAVTVDLTASDDLLVGYTVESAGAHAVLVEEHVLQRPPIRQ